VGDDGDGAVLCRVSCALTSTAPRDDCDDCVWAFDLVVSDAVVAEETDVGCAAFGYDADAVEAMNGTARSYGYAEEYVGHADMLMVYEADRWQGLAFATYSPASGELTYHWEDAYVPY